MDLIDLFEEIKKQENFTCGNGATKEEIDDFEKRLGITLPVSYKTFLETFGFALWFGHSIFGLSKDEEENALIHTLEAREDKLLEDARPLPLEAVILESYGGGGYYFLYCHPSPRAGEVILIMDETFWNEVESWQTFEDFIVYLLDI